MSIIIYFFITKNEKIRIHLKCFFSLIKTRTTMFITNSILILIFVFILTIKKLMLVINHIFVILIMLEWVFQIFWQHEITWQT